MLKIIFSFQDQMSCSRRTLNVCANGGEIRLVRVLRFLWSHRSPYVVVLTSLSSESMRLPSLEDDFSCFARMLGERGGRLTSEPVFLGAWLSGANNRVLSSSKSTTTITINGSHDQENERRKQVSLPASVNNHLSPQIYTKIHNFRPEPGRHDLQLQQQLQLY